MQEIRDIVRAGFDRRELLRMGLVMGGAGLAELSGFAGFRPYWAHAASGDGSDQGLAIVSPPNTPFVDPLPSLPVAQPTILDPAPTRGPNPIASALTGFTEVPRPDHQRWTQFGGASDLTPGFSSVQHEIVERAVLHDFYPRADGVPSSTIWTYVDARSGAVGPLWFQSRHGQPVLVRVHNALPLDNDGFGINQTSTHLHGAHSASESDGGPLQFYDAGQFKDFHYAHARSGFSKNQPTTTLNGRTVIGDVLTTQSTMWYHDHRVDFTAQNTYKGLVSFYTLYSDDALLDTGDETTGLRLPSGEFDIPMIFADKAFDPSTGQLFFDLFNLDGILGDKDTVNGKIQPFLEVKRRKYRFRLLVGGPSRVYEFFLSNGAPFFQLTNDGNLLPATLTRQSIRIAPAERVDVIVDFSAAKTGDRIYLQNRLEQVNGRGPTGKIIAPKNLVEFRITGDAADNSVIPGRLLDLPAPVAPVQQRQWKFDRSGGMWTVNGRLFDPGVISAVVKANTAEDWTLESGGGWTHPIHIHLEDLIIRSRDGKAPPADERGRKDVVRIGDSAVGTDDTGQLRLSIEFRDWLGDYPMHCHNTVHEDHAMMIRWQVVG
jgi:FtsP/CotA-like multicopper oxidase with cupredoxin domain